MVAKVVMMLRVWVMYSRSGLIIGILLTSFSVEIIFTILDAAINSDPKNVLGM